MSKNELRSSGKHRRCAFANSASELQQVNIFLKILLHFQTPSDTITV